MPVKITSVFGDTDEELSTDQEYDTETDDDETFAPITVEPIVFIYFVAFSVLSVMRAEYIVNDVANTAAGRHKYHGYVLHKETRDMCKSNRDPQNDFDITVQSDAAWWLLILNSVEMISALLAAPVLLSWSEKYGRRWALLLPNVGYLLSAAIFVCVIYTNASISYLIIAQFVQGIFGGFPTLMAMCNSYLTRTRDYTDRTLRLIILGLLSEVSTGLFQIGLGYWTNINSTFLPPYWCVIAGMVVNIIYIVFFLEELDEINGIRDTHLSPYDAVYSLLAFSNRAKLRSFLFVLFYLCVHMMILYSSLNLVLVHVYSAPLCWDTIRSGYFVAFTLFCGSIGTVLGSRFFLSPFEELGVSHLGIWSFIISLCLVAFGTDSEVVYAATFAGCFRFLVSPALRTRLVKLVDVDEQEAAFSLASFAETLGQFLGPIVFNSIYALIVPVDGAIVFVVMAFAYVFLSFTIAAIQMTCDTYSREGTPNRSEDEESLLPGQIAPSRTRFGVYSRYSSS